MVQYTTANLMLTKRQKQIVDFITAYTEKHGFAPLFSDIRKRMKLRSLATVHQHISALEQKGYVERQKRRARSIVASIKEKMISIPLLGTIAAGQLHEAIENKETIAVPQSRLPFPVKDCYALRVAGNSMIEENINDGDIVLVKKQETAKNGEKVVALVDGTDATLKRFYKERNQIRLQPANKTLKPIIIDKNHSVAIQGVVVGVVKTETQTAPAGLYPSPFQTSPAKKKPLNRILCGDAVEIMKTLPSSSIDIVVTSPPYDRIRDYKGFSLDLSAAGQEMHRILKDGGIVAMVIQDQTKNFGKSLTSFRTILDWCDRIGFKLFETVIYRKYGAEGAWWNKRFRVDHEYIPVFLKGERPLYFNKEHLKIPSKHGGKTMTGGGTRLTNGVRIATRSITINPTKCRGTIWEYMTAGDGSRLKHQHPATFPNQLPYDFIQCFCPKDGIVLDPFVGSGTTIVAAKNLGRSYIGIDIAQEYCEIAKKRIAIECAPENQPKIL